MFKNHNWWFLKWKYPKKELLWSQLLLIFLLLKYDVVHQWCINWKLRHISNRDIKLVVFPALHIFRSGQENHCFFFFFLDWKLLKTGLGGVLGGFLLLTESIMSVSFWNLIYHINHTWCWLILQFWVSISSCSPSRQSFYCFSCFL